MGRVLERAALFDGEAEPDRHAPTEMYLVAGDRVSVVDSTEGWQDFLLGGEEYSQVA